MDLAKSSDLDSRADCRRESEFSYRRGMHHMIAVVDRAVRFYGMYQYDMIINYLDEIIANSRGRMGDSFDTEYVMMKLQFEMDKYVIQKGNVCPASKTLTQ